jgi:hypothetical protein
MPFFIYHDKMTDAQPLNELDLEKAGVSESELRDMLAKNIQLLDDQSRLMVIAREYGSWGARRAEWMCWQLSRPWGVVAWSSWS